MVRPFFFLSVSLYKFLQNVSIFPRRSAGRRMNKALLAHTNCRIAIRRFETMSKKKKNKVRTLTEEQYNDYLMALKDERPTMLIDKNGKRTPQK